MNVPKFLIMYRGLISGQSEGEYFLALQMVNGKLNWGDPNLAMPFPSRYAAKRYMKLVHPKESGWIVVQQ